MTTVRRAALALSMLLACVCAAGETSLEMAKLHFNRGKQLYQDNDYQGALVEFRRAYELAPTYKLLYSMAEVQEQLRNWPAALALFRQYLRDGQGELSRQRQTEVQTEIDKLERRVASLSIDTVPAGAQVFVDDQLVGTTPLSAPVQVAAGRRKVTATLDGQTATQAVEVAGGESPSVVLRIPTRRMAIALPSSGVASAAAKPAGEPWGAWAVAGTLGVAGGVTGVFALLNSQKLKTQRNTFGVTAAQLDALSIRTRNCAFATDALWAAALVTAGVGAAIHFSAPTPQRSGVSLRLGATPQGLLVSGELP